MPDNTIPFPIPEDISGYPLLRCPCGSTLWEVLIDTLGDVKDETMLLGVRCQSCKKILKFIQEYP